MLPIHDNRQHSQHRSVYRTLLIVRLAGQSGHSQLNYFLVLPGQFCMAISIISMSASLLAPLEACTEIP